MVRWNSRIAAVLCALVAAACQSGKPAVEVPPELRFDKLEFRVYQGGRLEATGRAERASFRRDTADLRAESLRVRFPAAGDRAEAFLAAAEGQGNVRRRSFQVTGGVRAEQSGRTAESPEAHYGGEADGLVRGSQPVEVRDRSFVLTGPAFELDPRSGHIAVEGGAHLVAGGRAGR